FNWRAEAQEMVKTQIQKRGITDTIVINILKQTPRHEFVPSDIAVHAYSDHPLPIGEGQTISQPYIVALMTELLQLEGQEKVLEVGTGSGYQAAVLAAAADRIFTIEIVKVLADRARETLDRLGYDNVVVRWGDGYQGWPSQAPFDRIIVTAAPEKIPPALVDQLKVGGRMVIPVGSFWQELKVIIKTSETEIEEKSIIPVRFVPMVYPESPLPEYNNN
ncbi:MAG: protein-L-isoaspartate(D-aspartate) O-methyltransferase, partial [Candidatus Neomarinimicrobiota bacterium]